MKFRDGEGVRLVLIHWLQLDFSTVPLTLPFCVCQLHPPLAGELATAV